MYDLTNSQIGHFSQVHWGKTYTCHLTLGPLIKMYMPICTSMVSQLEPFEKNVLYYRLFEKYYDDILRLHVTKYCCHFLVCTWIENGTQGNNNNRDGTIKWGDDCVQR
jgi:hypothetical protein